MSKVLISSFCVCAIYPLRENWDTFGPGFLFNRATKEEITEEDVAKVNQGNNFDLCRL